MSEVLKDKIAIGTGAAGTMGLAATRSLLEDGCQVAMVDFNREQNEALAQRLGPNARAFSFDISDPEAVRNGHEAIAGAMGAVDILVNNAGILSNNKAEATGTAEWRRVLAAKTGGLTAGTAYSVSKGALTSLTFSLARELAPHGVTANGISPAYVKTPMITERRWPVSSPARSSISTADC
jgi:3-oxoacyl-[acyl-carrier protein] reductase